MLIFNLGCKPRGKKEVGVILAQEGQADFIGRPERKVLEAMMKNISQDCPFKLTLVDSESKSDRARALFDSFVENKNVIAVIGPSTSGESIPLAREAYDERIPLLSLAASKKIVKLDGGQENRWVFKFAQNDDLAAERLARLMELEQKTTIAFLYSNDGFGKSGQEVFGPAAKRHKLTITHEASFHPTVDIPGTYVDAIPKDIQGIVIWGTAGSDELVKEIRRREYGARIYLSHGNASESFIKSTGASSEGVILVGSRLLTEEIQLDESSPADEVIINYRNFWRDNFGGVPSHFGGHARDALQALLEVTRKIDFSQKTDKIRVDIRDAIEKLNPHYGVTGIFRFSSNDHAGLDIDAFATYIIQGGKFILYKK